MSGIRSVQPVVMARQPNFANTLGPIRRSTAFASVAELDMDR
jgi:hypothetical protein